MLKNRPIQALGHSRFRFTLAVGIFLLLASRSSALSTPQSVERRLRVKVENASVRLRPDAASPVVAVLKRGTVLMSYEAEAGWYRVVPGSEKDAVAVMGFLAAADVEVIEEKTVPPRDFWSDQESTFAGIGLDFVLTGGYAMFGGGDFASGVDGLYDDLKGRLANLGYAAKDEKHHAFNGGMLLSAGLYYRLTPRLAVGLTGEYSLAQRFDQFQFDEGVHALGATSTPILRTFILRPGLRYGIVIQGPVRLFLSAGPAIFFSSFQYDQATSYGFVPNQGTTHDFIYSIKANRNYFGAFAGAEADVRLTERAALLLQVVYRRASAAGWEGTEKTTAWVESYGKANGPEISGRLYATTRESRSVLVVSPASPASGAREASLDFSGLTLSTGMRIRF
ncbi:MAG: hypothetical protein NTZ26_10010 [Candidatus Aminicenantes bacterium]|nr:hypothetical protein [Candidatus Aminicenantes bacterium]